MIDSRVGTNEQGDPFVVVVATGTHDISRLLGQFTQSTCEWGEAARRLRKQARGTANTRRAMRLLQEHGGPSFVYTEDAAPSAVDLIREECVRIERDYVQALNALLAHPGEDGEESDYWRWQGHAERSRQIATRLRQSIGDPVPAYGSHEWRTAHGVYSDEQVNKWRDQERRRRQPELDPTEPAAICDLYGSLVLHLARRNTDGGTPGPTLCGIDRFQAGVGFSMGGAFVPGAERQWQCVTGKNAPRKEVCVGCLAGREVLIAQLAAESEAAS
jgi:hypothetical protein